MNALDVAATAARLGLGLAFAIILLRAAGVVRPFSTASVGRALLAGVVLLAASFAAYAAVSLLEKPSPVVAATVEPPPAAPILFQGIMACSWVIIRLAVQTAVALFVLQAFGLATTQPQFNELALFGAIVVAALLTTAVDNNHSYYMRPGESLRDIARNVAMLGIFALGATVVIIAGGIDLSSGSTIAFCGTVCAALMLVLAPKEITTQKPVGMPVVLAALAGTVLVGFLVGTLHTWLITAIRLPPFIATLATLVGLRSFARALCEFATANAGGGKSSQIYLNDPFFHLLRDNVCVGVAVFCLLAIVTWVILNYTVLGRHVYALGGNETAAKLSGIRTDNVKWFAYCFAAITSSIAAVFYIANFSVASPVDQARGHELNAIAAAVVGGCSLQGGLGTISGTILGAIFLRLVIDSVAKVIKTGADVYEGMIVGVVVVIAVTFSQIRQLIGSGRKLFPGLLGVCAIPTLSLLTGLVVMMTFGKWLGISSGVAALMVLSAIKVLETSAARPSSGG